MVNWNEHTKLILPFSCSNTTQDKKKALKALKARRRVLIIGKARRQAGRQAGRHEGAQFSRLADKLLQEFSFNSGTFKKFFCFLCFNCVFNHFYFSIIPTSVLSLDKTNLTIKGERNKSAKWWLFISFGCRELIFQRHFQL